MGEGVKAAGREVLADLLLAQKVIVEIICARGERLAGLTATARKGVVVLERDREYQGRAGCGPRGRRNGAQERSRCAATCISCRNTTSSPERKATAMDAGKNYKWIALSNTTLGTLMASINNNIVLISLPSIFNGLGINPLAPNETFYLLWILMGYSVVVATLLVSFGRLSDMFGRVRLYNLGFAVFTAASILLFFTPSRGDAGALEIVVFRMIQAIGGGFLLANSAAILTDAFPPLQRGMALGLNQIAFIRGSLIGLILGGFLAAINWRLVFLVSVPVGVAGTIWAYLKLKETGRIARDQKLDLPGVLTFGAGLVVLLVALNYGIMPFGHSLMGWGNPLVVAGIALGLAPPRALRAHRAVGPDTRCSA